MTEVEGEGERVLERWADERRVAAVVVNYRTPAFTIACVESLLRSAGVPPRVIIVDNASGDDSVERIRAAVAEFPEGGVTVLARSTNDGYTGGNNAGVALARGMNAQYAFILNADTLVDADCVRLLVDEAERDTLIALVTPQIFFGDPPDRLWFGGGRFSLWHGRPIHVGRRERATPGGSEPRDIAFATGCALLVRLAASANLEDGVFDASLFSYAEDLDLSLRVARAGYRIRYVPQARVWHFEGSSHRQAGGQALRFYLTTRNLLRVVARHARWYHWVTLAPMLAADVIGRYCAVAIRDRDRATFVSVLRGAWHAVTGGTHPIESARGGGALPPAASAQSDPDERSATDWNNPS